ncbi:MAG: putative protein YaaQ [Fimbriimonadaceae bacterium]|nr:putative protein YaaQ [Fimbriimonadaceae bacterium]
MKLCLCIVHNRDKTRIGDELIKAGFKMTMVASTGGFLREGNTTFMIGVEDDELPALKALIMENCRAREQVVNVGTFESSAVGAFMTTPVKVPVGGAVLFVMPVEEYERY